MLVIRCLRASGMREYVCKVVNPATRPALDGMDKFNKWFKSKLANVEPWTGYYVVNHYAKSGKHIGEHTDSHKLWGPEGDTAIATYTVDQAAIFIIMPAINKEHKTNDDLLTQLHNSVGLRNWGKKYDIYNDCFARQCVNAVLCRANSMLVMGGYFQSQLTHQTVPHDTILEIYRLWKTDTLDNLLGGFSYAHTNAAGYDLKLHAILLRSSPNWQTIIEQYVGESIDFVPRTVITMRHVRRHDQSCCCSSEPFTLTMPASKSYPCSLHGRAVQNTLETSTPQQDMQTTNFAETSKRPFGLWSAHSDSSDCNSNASGDAAVQECNKKNKPSEASASTLPERAPAAQEPPQVPALPSATTAAQSEAQVPSPAPAQHPSSPAGQEPQHSSASPSATTAAQSEAQVPLTAPAQHPPSPAGQEPQHSSASPFVTSAAQSAAQTPSLPGAQQSSTSAAPASAAQCTPLQLLGLQAVALYGKFVIQCRVAEGFKDLDVCDLIVQEALNLEAQLRQALINDPDSCEAEQFSHFPEAMYSVVALCQNFKGGSLKVRELRKVSRLQNVTKAVLDGKTGNNGTVYRIVMPTRDLIAIFGDAMVDTVVQLKEKLAHAKNTTVCGQDVLTIQNNKLVDNKWHSMARTFEERTWSRPLSRGNKFFVQAIEWNRPVLETASERYQFEADKVETWDVRLQEYMTIVKERAVSEYRAYTKAGMVRIGEPWPAPTEADDMPIVVRPRP